MFHKKLVSKIFLDKRRGRGGGSILIFCENFCLTVPQVFLEERFCVSKILKVSKHFIIMRVISRFSGEFFVSYCRKTS